MKKIIIVSFYDLKDYLLYIKEQFEKFYYTVLNYPLFRYAYDSNDKIDNYKEHMNDYLNETNPDIILWWFIDVPVDVFKYIRQNHKNKTFIMYNSDDPINLNKELFDKAKLFDIVMTPCKDTMHLYKLYSDVPCVIFNPMGYDPELFKQRVIQDIPADEYENFNCDISMIVYNLFYDKSYYNQLVYQKDQIDNIAKLCEENKYVFKLYGSPILKELYENNYCGEIPYYKLNFLFNCSKLNIISSPFKNKSLYINGYVFSILGCGGIIMHDKTKDINKLLINNENCILYNEKNYTEKIIEFLDNYDNNIDTITQIKINAQETAKNYTWNIWVENIIKEIGKRNFDEDLYAELYGLDKNINGNLLEYWLSTGIKEKQICYQFDVPDNFDYESYTVKYNIKNNIQNSHRIAYLHWFINSNDNIYLKKKANRTDIASFDYGGCNIIMEDYFNICSILNKIIQTNTRDVGLSELDDYCKKIPYIKINEILNKYIESVF